MKNLYDKQNEEKILRLLFASKKIYNRASLLNSLQWFIAFVGAIISNVDLVKGVMGQSAVILLSAVCVFTTFYLQGYIQKTVQLGADMKELIDRTLFGFDVTGSIGGHDKSHLYEAAINEQQNDLKNYNIAIKNTGTDKPKGVKNWYERSSNKDGNEAILQCQKENIWYDKKISRLHAIICGIALAAIVILFVVSYGQLSFISFLLVVCSYASLVIKIIADLLQYLEFKKYSLQAEVTVQAIEKGDVLTTKMLMNLQDYIYKRRATNYITYNFIHTILSPKLHETWKEKGRCE